MKEKIHKYVYKGPNLGSRALLSCLVGRFSNPSIFTYGDEVNVPTSLLDCDELKCFFEEGKKYPNFRHRLISLDKTEQFESATIEEKKASDTAKGTEHFVQIGNLKVDINSVSRQELQEIAENLNIKQSKNTKTVTLKKWIIKELESQKEEDSIDFDLNNDGVVDEEDRSIAGKLLASDKGKK